MPASLRAHASRATPSRPYDRRSPTASPAQSDTVCLSRGAPLASPVQAPNRDADTDQNEDADVPPDRPGLPTYAEYKRIEAAYLQSLSPRKRDKALITQVMFDKIWDVLHQPDACTVETPQFRFWVRKMFTLSRQAAGGPGSDVDSGWRGGESEAAHALQDAEEDEADLELGFTAIVLHENRPVAILEQLYELFCYCHVRAGHGGRDKTCAVIREHYSWVPKELTAQFVKACPTCMSKRNGHPVVGLDIGVVEQRRGRGRRRGRAAPLGVEAEGTSLSDRPSSLGWPTTGGPLDPANPRPCGMREREREWFRVYEDVGSAGLPSLVSPRRDSRSRIVPIENNCVAGGWNSVPRTAALKLTTSSFHPSDTTCSPGHPFLVKSIREDKENHSPTKTQLPSLATALSDNSLDDQVDLAGPTPGDEAECPLPPALRPLRLSGPVPSNSESDLAGLSNPLQIDPVLLSLNYPPGPSLSSNSGLASDAASLALRDDVASEAHRFTSFPGLRAQSNAEMRLPAFEPSPSSESNSPDSSFERSATCLDADGAAAATLPFSISTEFMTRSRCGPRYSGPLAMLYHCSADEVSQDFDGHGPFSFSIMSDA